MAKYRVTDNLTGKVFEAEAPDDATPEELQTAFEDYLRTEPAKEENYFDRLMGKVRETEQVMRTGLTRDQLQGMSPQQIEAATRSFTSGLGTVVAPIEAAMALGPGSVAGLAGQTVGAGAGYLTALAEGLSPGTQEFNRRVGELQTAGGQLAMAPFEPTSQLGQQIVGGVQEALAPLPPTLGMGDIVGQAVRGTQAAVGGTRIRAAAAQPPTPGLGEAPPMVGPAAPATSVELARALRAEDEAALAAAATPSTELQAAQTRLGTQLTPEFITERPQFRELARSLETPRSETAAIRKAAIEDLQTRITGLAEKYGGTRDLGQIDVETRNQMFRSVKDLENQAQIEYKNLDRLVNPQGRSAASNVIGFIEQQIQREGGMSGLSAQERRIYNRLRPREVTTKSGTRIIEPTYGLIDRTRKELTAAKYENKGPFKDAQSGLITKLEMELAKDQEAAVAALGKPGASDVYRNARTLVATRKGLEDRVVDLFGAQTEKNKVVGQFTGDLVGAVKTMRQGDFDAFEKIVTALPQNMRKRAVTSSIVDSIAKNPDGFINWYEGVNRNSRARMMVKKYVEPEFLRDMTAGYKLSKSVENFYKQVPNDRLRTVVTSGDGVIKTFLRNAGPRIAEYIGSGGRRQTGVANIAVTSALTPKTRKLQLANEFLTSADFGELIKTLNTPNQIKGVRRAARTKTFNNYADAIGLPKPVNQRELWLLDAIQSGAQLQEEQQPMQAQ